MALDLTYAASPHQKEQTVNTALNAIPKEITKQEIFAAFGATADSKKDIASKTSDLKDPYGIEILRVFGAII